MLLVSMGFRYVVNIHALNNEGSAGALTRVRRVPYVFIGDNGYYLREVNVVSGQSIAHSIQEHIVDLALEKGINVCETCKRYVFVKQASETYFSERVKKALEKAKEAMKGDSNKKEKLKKAIQALKEAEKEIIDNCVVEDVGGFMVAAKNYPNVRRESTIKVSFLAPIMDANLGEYSYIESLQFARHDPTAAIKSEKTEESQQETKEASGQMLFVQEVAGGIYAVKLDFEASRVGHTSSTGFEKALDDEEIMKRVDVTLEAIRRSLGWFQFGAKRSRFNPIEALVEAVIVVSDGLPVASPFVGDFYEETKRRVEIYTKSGGFAKIFHYKLGSGKSFDEVFNEVKKVVLEKLNEQLSK